MKIFSSIRLKMKMKIDFLSRFLSYYIYYIIFLIKMSRFLQQLHKIYIKIRKIIKFCSKNFLFEYLYFRSKFPLKIGLEWTKTLHNIQIIV